MCELVAFDLDCATRPGASQETEVAFKAIMGYSLTPPALYDPDPGRVAPPPNVRESPAHTQFKMPHIKLSLPQTTPAAASPRARQTNLAPARRARRLARRLAPFALSLVLVASVAFRAPQVAAQGKKAQPAPVFFVGEVEYRVSAGGSNEEGLAAFKAFSPTTIKIIYGREGFQIVETGGTEQHVLLNYATGAAYLLDAGAKTATKVNVMNLDDKEGAQLAAIMPYHYRTDMQPTGATANVAGQPCREYKVLKSAFVRAGAAATVCVAEGLRFKPSRYNFENESTRVISPLPLSLPVPRGAILRMEIKESGVEAVYEAVRITPGAPPPSLFSVPAGYKLKTGK